MLDVLVAGGMGAVVNYALFSHWFSSGVMLALDTLLKELGLVIQMGSGINTLFSVLFCLFGGTLFMVVWQFMKARMIRFLLATNIWFLHPKHPLSKVQCVRECCINNVPVQYIYSQLILCQSYIFRIAQCRCGTC